METGFIKIRSVKTSEWEDRENSYHYSTNVPRYSHIKPGVKFLLETKYGSVWHFIGYGTFDKVERENGDDDNKEYYRAYYKDFTPCSPTPNTFANRIIKELGFGGPMAYIQASILSIPKNTYDQIKSILKASTKDQTKFTEDQAKWAAFQLWIMCKYNRMTDNIEKNESESIRKFRKSFPYLTDETDAERPRPTVKYPTNKWVNEETAKDTWHPRRWGCIKTQDLMNKGTCQLECEYSPQHNEDKCCKDGYGALWFRANRNAKFSPIYLQVIEEQIIEEKLDYDEFCQFIINRRIDVPSETKEWVKEKFHFTQSELGRIFNLEEIENEIIKLSQLSTLQTSIVENLKDKPQIILYGPPGTGKTVTAMEVAKHIVHPAGSENIIIIQFHPSYTYQEFVEGLFPESKDGDIYYDFRSGHFKRICKLGIENPDQNYAIIVDEINRANLSKVMGELFYSLEYRGEEFSLRLSSSPDEEFYTPENVYVIGTMNTADRSLADIDIALRRRFRFIEIPPDSKILENYYATEDNRTRVKQFISLFEHINQKLLQRLGNRDILVGHSYFMLSSLENRQIKNFLFYELIPLLEDYFYQDRREVGNILGDVFFKDIDTMLLKKPQNFDLTNYLERFD